MSVLLFLRSNTSRLRYTSILSYVGTLTYITLQVLLAEMTYIFPQSTYIDCNLGLIVWLRYTSACLQEEPGIKSPMIWNVMLLPQVQFVTNITDYKSQPDFSTFMWMFWKYFKVRPQLYVIRHVELTDLQAVTACIVRCQRNLSRFFSITWK